VGLSLAAFGLCSAFVQGWLIRKLLVWLGEMRTAIFGFSMHIVAVLILTFIQDGFMVFLFMPITALGVVVGPALQGMMADRLPDNEQGELQGVLASVNGIAVIVSPLLMTGVFRIFTAEETPVYLPGAPFLAAGLLAAVALWLLLQGARRPATA
ncbi:MAG: tetracycline resistance MFS efflux pump, partial [Pseudomonadota bacterium]